jgi:hypothetical protein
MKRPSARKCPAWNAVRIARITSESLIASGKKLEGSSFSTHRPVAGLRNATSAS